MREKGHKDHKQAGDRGGWAAAEIFQRERAGANEEASLSWTVRPSVISTGRTNRARFTDSQWAAARVSWLCKASYFSILARPTAGVRLLLLYFHSRPSEVSYVSM